MTYISGKKSQFFLTSIKKYQHLKNNLDYHMKADLTLIG